MITEKKPGTLAELARADWRLRLLVDQVVDELGALGWDFALTCVERDPDETRALYAANGKTPPAASVHDQRPCRGADGVPARQLGVEPIGTLENVARLVADRINARVHYPRGKNAVLWHDVAGAHLHVQVPPDELGLRA